VLSASELARPATTERSSLAAFLDELQSRGTHTFTRDDAASADWRNDAALKSALRRLKEKGHCQARAGD
jgi:hypothetical protein